jgi:hypothetical protein
MQYINNKELNWIIIIIIIIIITSVLYLKLVIWLFMQHTKIKNWIELRNYY